MPENKHFYYDFGHNTFSVLFVYLHEERKDNHMKKKVVAVICIGLLTAMFVQSCEINGCSRSVMVSNTNGRDSQKMQGDCMNCHGPNGNGRGCFTIGGTVYDSLEMNANPNSVIMLYTQSNGGGQLVATLDVDKSGNFYTTSVINFGSGLYPAVVSKSTNEIQYMPTPIVTGACGSCHGILNAKIWVN